MHQGMPLALVEITGRASNIPRRAHNHEGGREMDMHQAVENVTKHPEQVQQASEQLQALLVRSATDIPFRQMLLADPRAAFAEFAGRPVSELPASFNLVFVENTADATFVLPDPIDLAAELSEQELEAVAGGTTPSSMACIAAGLWVIGEAINLYNSI
jgi:hypothetical protein